MAHPSANLFDLATGVLYNIKIFAGNNAMFEETGSQPIQAVPLAPVTNLFAAAGSPPPKKRI